MVAEVIGVFLAGLGFFCLGVRLITEKVRSLFSLRLQKFILKWVDNSWLASFWGLFCGGVTQDNGVVSYLTANMAAAPGFKLKKALPIINWSNVGGGLPFFLVFLNINVAILYIIGIASLLLYYERLKKLKVFAEFSLAFGILFYGIILIKSSSDAPGALQYLRESMLGIQGAYVASFFLGALLRFITQSTTAIMISLMSLTQAKVLGIEETMMMVYGIHIGASLSNLIMYRGLKGIAYQVLMSQVLFNIAVVMLFFPAFYLEMFGGVPLVKALIESLSTQFDRQMAWLYLIASSTTAALLTFYAPWEARLLEKLAPSRTDDDFSRPRFLNPLVLEDFSGTSALLLKEESFLSNKLLNYYDETRAILAQQQYAFDSNKYHLQFASLFRELRAYIDEVIRKPLTEEASSRLLLELEILEGLIALEENLYKNIEFVRETIEQHPLPVELKNLIETLVEAENAVLFSFVEGMDKLDSEDIDILLNITEDRGDLIKAVQQKSIKALNKHGEEYSSITLYLTSLFERNISIIRKLSLLLQKIVKEN